MTPKKILRRPQPADQLGWGQNLPPILRRLYAARGVQSDEQLQYTLKHLASPMQLRGIDRAVELLATAVVEKQKVMVLGDFDADGATSTAVAMLGLSMLGVPSDQRVARPPVPGAGRALGGLSGAQSVFRRVWPDAGDHPPVAG